MGIRRIGVALAGAVMLVGAGAGAASASNAHHPTVTIKQNHLHVVVGGHVTLTGHVSPNEHGHPVRLQRYSGGHWHTLSSTKLSAGSRYRFRLHLTHTGTKTYRVRDAAMAGWSAASSRRVRVKVVASSSGGSGGGTNGGQAQCYPLSNSGTCYEPGEFCRNSDHGVSGVAGDGEAIQCEDNNGWRWEAV